MAGGGPFGLGLLTGLGGFGGLDSGLLLDPEAMAARVAFGNAAPGQAGGGARVLACFDLDRAPPASATDLWDVLALPPDPRTLVDVATGQGANAPGASENDEWDAPAATDEEPAMEEADVRALQDDGAVADERAAAASDTFGGKLVHVCFADEREPGGTFEAGLRQILAASDADALDVKGASQKSARDTAVLFMDADEVDDMDHHGTAWLLAVAGAMSTAERRMASTRHLSGGQRGRTGAFERKD